MPQTYYALIEWNPFHGWSPQFGDYSRRVVRDEWRDSYKGNGKKYKIISSRDDEDSIRLAIESEGALLE